MEWETLLFEQRDRLGIVTLNRPDRLNSLNQTMVREIRELFAGLRGKEDLGVVIITGAGDRAFSAGADISEFQEIPRHKAFDFTRAFQSATGQIEALGKPVIAAVNGLALGGGCEIALACTLRILSQKARMGLPEVNLGVIPGAGGTQRLPRLVGKGVALWYLLTAEAMDAQEAYRIGLANKVVAPEELMPTCLETAKLILQKGPIAIRMVLQSVNVGLNTDIETGLIHEAMADAQCLISEDMAEGAKAFLEKRPPQFKGH
ncbi:MAG: enoyl-CoA hydratase/isomerase family protein [Chloroflexi bacterium]|nr:enoyl-CoA hydratase/isomerase family protein [Chloroflexota bacterium]